MHIATAPAAEPRTASQIRAGARRPRLPAALRYALLRRPAETLHKPVAYAHLADLARALHRDRHDAPIELQDAALLLRGEDEARGGVSIWTLGEDGQRARYLGWAFLAGGGRQALEAALFAARPAPEVG